MFRTHYYDYQKGWDATNPGWHLVEIPTPAHRNFHDEMVDWLYDHIDNPERHARWVRLNAPNDISCFRFRYERDCIWFKLRWS